MKDIIRDLIRFAMILIIIGGIIIYFYPVIQYEYISRSNADAFVFIYRIDRFTGAASRLTNHGWEEVLK